MSRIVPLILAVALFMENLDSTVIATSLPAIAADIGTSPIALKLALTAYFVSLAIFIPISGWMADRFGSTAVFRAAIGVFIVGSVCCAFSNSLETFVLSRFLQGMGGSMMTPVARLVLLRATPRNELVNAMAWLTVPGLIGPLAGPPVGGFFATYLSWHWIFWINVPIGLIGIVAATKFLPKTEPRTPRPIDIRGFLLSAVTFSGIIFGLSVVSMPALPVAAGYIATAVGLIAGIVYLVHAKRVEFPLLDPKLFRNRNFRTSILGSTFFRIGMGAFPFLMPLMLQLIFGLTPFESGMLTFVAALGAILSKLTSEWVFARFGFPRVLTASAVLGAVFLGINALFTPETPHIWLLLALFTSGISRSFFFTGVNVFGYTDVDVASASQATAITTVSQQIAIALGVAVGGGLLELSNRMTGGPIDLMDFQVAWVAVALLGSLSAVFFMRLPPDAGADVSGHKMPPVPTKSDPLA